MRCEFLLFAALSLAWSVSGIKILMGNDDGFGSGNLRELYRMLKDAGHEVVIIAPALQQSGQGGRVGFAETRNLSGPSQYDLIPSGAPSLGQDPHDQHIWYYNGTPAACLFVGLDYVLPKHYPSWTQSPDLFVAGPNYGTNLGPFVYSLSGTVGATYSAIARSIPGIALSASNDAVPYFNVSKDGKHPATRAARVSFEIVNEFINQSADGQRILPLGYGINVNIPELESDAIPQIVQSRLTGEANVDVAVYDEESGTFDWDDIGPKAAGLNACYNGDCGLPGETAVVGEGMVSVSAFTVDYTAPRLAYTDMVFGKVGELFRKKGEDNGARKVKRGLKVGRDLKD